MGNRCRSRKEKFSVYQTFQIVERKSEHGNHCAGGLVRPGRRYALSVDRFMTQNGTKIHIYLELCKICRRLTFLKLYMCKITIHSFMKWNGTKIHIYLELWQIFAHGKEQRLTFFKLCMCKILEHSFMTWNVTNIYIYVELGTSLFDAEYLRNLLFGF